MTYRVLIADDVRDFHPTLECVVEAVCRANGETAEIDHVYNTNELIQKGMKNHYNLIITDGDMQDGYGPDGGIQGIEKILKNKKNLGLTTILFSGSSDELKENALFVGINYITCKSDGTKLYEDLNFILQDYITTTQAQ